MRVPWSYSFVLDNRGCYCLGVYCPQGQVQARLPYSSRLHDYSSDYSTLPWGRYSTGFTELIGRHLFHPHADSVGRCWNGEKPIWVDKRNIAQPQIPGWQGFVNSKEIYNSCRQWQLEWSISRSLIFTKGNISLAISAPFYCCITGPLPSMGFLWRTNNL